MKSGEQLLGGALALLVLPIWLAAELVLWVWKMIGRRRR